MVGDRQIPVHYFNRKFEVHIPSKEEWMENSENLLQSKGLTWFTDGSRIGEMTGGGVRGVGPKVNFRFPLGSYATVFQAEVYSILSCVVESLNRSYSGKHILILSDSKGALLALLKYKISSKLILDCIEKLQVLAESNHVTLRWIPAHCGYEGNEVADSLAREACGLPFFGPEPCFGIPYKLVKRQLENWQHKEHLVIWNAHKPRQTGLFCKGPDVSRAGFLLSLGRTQLKTITGIITGHGSFGKHLHKLGIQRDPRCRHCGEEEETSTHLLIQCTMLTGLRNKVFGANLLDPIDLQRINWVKLLNYFQVLGSFPGTNPNSNS